MLMDDTYTPICYLELIRTALAINNWTILAIYFNIYRNKQRIASEDWDLE